MDYQSSDDNFEEFQLIENVMLNFEDYVENQGDPGQILNADNIVSPEVNDCTVIQTATEMGKLGENVIMPVIRANIDEKCQENDDPLLSSVANGCEVNYDHDDVRHSLSSFDNQSELFNFSNSQLDELINSGLNLEVQKKTEKDEIDISLFPTNTTVTVGLSVKPTNNVIMKTKTDLVDTMPQYSTNQATDNNASVLNLQCYTNQVLHGQPDVANESSDISDQQLLMLNVKELNTLMRNMPKDKKQSLKQRRRTLKNRGYAQNCRSKRVLVKTEQEVTIRNLNDQLSQVMQERDYYKRRCESCTCGSVSRCLPGTPETPDLDEPFY